MKKKNLSKTIKHYFKNLRHQFESLKAGPLYFQVDLGSKSTRC
jgi:hypothetical protein